ncbi:MAG: CHRD domain-containing protein [Pyrinomonadaceae bacterium]
MKRKAFLLSVVLLSTVTALAVFTDGYRRIKQTLTGFEEIPTLSTPANGEFRAKIGHSQIEWTLTYSDTDTAVQQAHIHLGPKGVNGPITVFLCTNLGNGPEGSQPCPAAPATVSGTIQAADVSPNIGATAGARAQGLDTGDYDEFLDALRAGVLYVNVHTVARGGGEIRSQIDGHNGKHGGEDK